MQVEMDARGPKGRGLDFGEDEGGWLSVGRDLCCTNFPYHRGDSSTLLY